MEPGQHRPGPVGLADLDPDLDLAGQEQRLEAEGLLAVCIQHEIDHLNGKVFVDHLSQLKQTRIRTKLAKQARVTA